jgi:hypothetical protein
LVLVLLRQLIKGVDGGFGTALMSAQEANWGRWRPEWVVPGAAWFAHAHVERPGHPARVAGQERGCFMRCREHAFGCADDVLARGE